MHLSQTSAFVWVPQLAIFATQSLPPVKTVLSSAHVSHLVNASGLQLLQSLAVHNGHSPFPAAGVAVPTGQVFSQIFVPAL